MRPATTSPLKTRSSLLSTLSLFPIFSRSVSSTSPVVDPKSTDPNPQMDPPSSPIHVAIDAGSSVRKPISLWPGMYHSPVTNALWEARSSIFERLLDPPSKDGPPQSELLTKSPSQSRTSIIYKFASDYILREQYRDPSNEIRIGKLLEDLDALAGTIAFKAFLHVAQNLELPMSREIRYFFKAKQRSEIWDCIFHQFIAVPMMKCHTACATAAPLVIWI